MVAFNIKQERIRIKKISQSECYEIEKINKAKKRKCLFKIIRDITGKFAGSICRSRNMEQDNFT